VVEAGSDGGGGGAFYPPASGYLLDFIILFLGWIGAAVYIVVEVIPDAGCCARPSRCFRGGGGFMSWRRRSGIILRRGNYEELGLLYLDDGDFGEGAGLL